MLSEKFRLRIAPDTSLHCSFRASFTAAFAVNLMLDRPLLARRSERLLSKFTHAPARFAHCDPPSSQARGPPTRRDRSVLINSPISKKRDQSVAANLTHKTLSTLRISLSSPWPWMGLSNQGTGAT